MVVRELDEGRERTLEMAKDAGPSRPPRVVSGQRNSANNMRCHIISGTLMEVPSVKRLNR